MESYYSKDFILKINRSLLNKDYDVNEINNFFVQIFDTPHFNDSECNTLLLIACNLVDKDLSFNGLTKLVKTQVEIRMILETLFPPEKDKCDVEPHKPCDNVKQKDKNENMDYGAPSDIELLNSDEEIAEFFRKKYTSFPPSAHPELQYPAEGSTIIMKLRDNLSFPGKTYFAQFEIDHNGKVLRMVGEPKTPNLNRDYSKIYQGLLGQVMEYQEVK